jgi:hypothetical protein
LGITIFTVSHRKSLARHHDFQIDLDGRGGYTYTKYSHSKVVEDVETIFKQALELKNSKKNVPLEKDVLQNDSKDISIDMDILQKDLQNSKEENVSIEKSENSKEDNVSIEKLQN